MGSSRLSEAGPHRDRLDPRGKLVTDHAQAAMCVVSDLRMKREAVFRRCQEWGDVFFAGITAKTNFRCRPNNPTLYCYCPATIHRLILLTVYKSVTPRTGGTAAPSWWSNAAPRSVAVTTRVNG